MVTAQKTPRRTKHLNLSITTSPRLVRSVIGCFQLLVYFICYVNFFRLLSRYSGDFLNKINNCRVYKINHLKTLLRGHSPYNIAYTSSLKAFFQFSATLISGPVADQHGPLVHLTALSNSRQIDTYIGMLTFIVGFPGLVGTPITGVLTTYYHYTEGSYPVYLSSWLVLQSVCGCGILRCISYSHALDSKL